MIPDLLDRTFAGNTASAWAWTIGTIVVLVGVLAIVKHLLLRRLGSFAKRTRTQADDLVVILLRRSRYAIALWLALVIAERLLVVPAEARPWLSSLAVIAALVQIGIWANGVVEFWVANYSREHLTADATSVTTIKAAGFAVRVLAWAFVLLLALDNVGVDVTALIAGLGIGGIAVALAVQNVLGDVLAAMAIVIDKPFVLGDFIIVGSELGTVESIGIKTTRLRSLGGEQIIFSNSDLLGSRIRNYKRMSERRVLFRFGVMYDTPPHVVEQLATAAKEAVTAQPGVRFDRAHFASFGDSSLDFEVVYYVLSPDYTVYMDVQQGINLALLRRVRELGSDFAFPTRTLHVEGWLGRPAADAEDGAAAPASPDRASRQARAP